MDNELHPNMEWTALNVRLNSESSVQRQIFIRKIVSNVFEDIPDCSLLVGNIPPFVDERCLEKLFSNFGSVARVLLRGDKEFDFSEKKKSKYFDTQAVTGKLYAAIVFEEKQAIDEVFELTASRGEMFLYENEEPFSGLKKWKHEYNETIIDEEDLQNEIDNYMKIYDMQMEEERKRAKEKEGVADEEGWITVSRHGKRSFIPNNEYVDNLILSKKRKYDKVLTNFYNFQRTQGKIDSLSNLRTKFEEDKKRLAMMKATRKFKPL